MNYCHLYWESEELFQSESVGGAPPYEMVTSSKTIPPSSSPMDMLDTLWGCIRTACSRTTTTDTPGGGGGGIQYHTLPHQLTH